MALRGLLCLAVALAIGAGTAYAKPGGKGGKKPQKTPEECFKAADKNVDGFVTAEELTGKGRKPNAAEKAKQFIQQRDKNGDGKLDKAEFTAKVGKKKGKGKGKKSK
jgi:hypothetical protein